MTEQAYKNWWVGAQNDILYIIDEQPRPSNDDQIHDRDVKVIAKFYDKSEIHHTVAARNACKGITTEALERLAEIGGVETLIKGLDDSEHASHCNLVIGWRLPDELAGSRHCDCHKKALAKLEGK